MHANWRTPGWHHAWPTGAWNEARSAAISTEGLLDLARSRPQLANFTAPHSTVFSHHFVLQRIAHMASSSWACMNGG